MSCGYIALIIVLLLVILNISEYNTRNNTEAFADRLGSYYAHALTQPAEQYYTYLPLPPSLPQYEVP